MAVAGDNTMAKVKAWAWKWAKRLYWIIGILALLGACYFLYNTMQRQMASVLLFVGGIIALYFYWVKWFLIPELRPSWPPVVAPCPDYLTLVDPGDGKTKPALCKDFVGVSANGRLKRSLPTAITTNLGDSNYTFQVPLNYTDPNTGAVTKVSLSDICKQVDEYGLTWMGICPEA
jgi:hypothetical protein